MWLVGVDADHPDALESGAVEDPVTRYPVTPKSSVAMKELTATVSDVELAGSANAVTVGGVVSTIAFTANDTALEMPPPGAGLVTVMELVEVAASREAGMIAAIAVDDASVVVAMATLLNWTVVEA